MKRHFKPEARKRADAYLNASIAYLYTLPLVESERAAREKAYVDAAESLARWVVDDFASKAVIRAHGAAAAAMAGEVRA